MKRKDVLKKAGKPIFYSALIIISIAVAIMLITANTSDMVVEQVVHQKKWQPLPMGEASPGAGASGVLNTSILAHPHFDPYTSNITYNASFYSDSGAGDVNNSHIGSDIPYNTVFDIHVKVRFNRTHCYQDNGSGNGYYNLSWIRGNITCAALSLSDAAMDEYNITGCGTGQFIWVNYIMDNSGAGYTISRGQNITSCSFNFDAYY